MRRLEPVADAAVRIRPPGVWIAMAVAVSFSVATILVLWLITVPQGPPSGCAWDPECSLVDRALPVTVVVVALGVATSVAALASARWARWVTALGLIVLVTAPIWAHVATRGHLWGPLPL